MGDTLHRIHRFCIENLKKSLFTHECDRKISFPLVWNEPRHLLPENLAGKRQKFGFRSSESAASFFFQLSATKDLLLQIKGTLWGLHIVFCICIHMHIIIYLCVSPVFSLQLYMYRNRCDPAIQIQIHACPFDEPLWGRCVLAVTRPAIFHLSIQEPYWILS